MCLSRYGHELGHKPKFVKKITWITVCEPSSVWSCFQQTSHDPPLCFQRFWQFVVVHVSGRHTGPPKINSAGHQYQSFHSTLWENCSQQAGGCEVPLLFCWLRKNVVSRQEGWSATWGKLQPAERKQWSASQGAFHPLLPAGHQSNRGDELLQPWKHMQLLLLSAGALHGS